MLETEQVSHRYGRHRALRDVTFRADNGVTGVLGRNGAGKTTLLGVLAGLIRPSGGSLRMGGRDVTRDAAALRVGTSYLPQDPSLPLDARADTFVKYLLRLSGAPHDRARRWLEEFGIDPQIGSRRLAAYSGGMRQRVALACTFATERDIMLLDEPTHGLDPWERFRLHAKLAEIASERVVIFSTHIVADIEAVASRLIVLDQGGVLFDGQTGDFLAHQATEPCWMLCATRTSVTLDGNTVTRVRKRSDGRFEIRGVGSSPPAGAVEVEATLEDRYLRLTDARA